jgi:hypothetical protein
MSRPEDFPKLPAELRHEYESPRDERYPDSPCAVCGAKRWAEVHG